MKKVTYFAAMLTILLLAGNVPAVESIRGLTIHVEYPDAPAWLTYSRIDNLLNGTGYIEPGAERSVRDYWSQNSRGNIDVTQDIYFYTAPRNTPSYTTWQETVEMLRGCMIWFRDTHPGYDWNALSKHPDNKFISINFISSEPGVPGVGGAHSLNWFAPNGVKVGRMQICWLKNTWDPNPINLFVYCHEQGHAMFGFPDTYDTDYSSGGTGFYSLMSGGLDRMEPVGAPFMAQEGWCSVIDAAPGTQHVTLTADGSEIARYVNPANSLEYFVIEARRRATIGNNLFPVNVGLLIWHTDNNVSTSNRLENMTPGEHYRHSIEQADGNFDLENKINRGDQGDIFLPGREFTPATSPNSNWWDGTASDLSITNIQINGNQVSFNVGTVQKLVSHYLFNGNLTDSAGNYNGTGYGNFGYVRGPFDQSLDLDGSTGYVDCGTGPGSAGNLTFAFWMNSDTEAKYMRAISKRDNSHVTPGWEVMVRPSSENNAVRFAVQGNGSDGWFNSVVANNAYTVGNWSHIACSFDGATGTSKIYVNGQLIDSRTDLAACSVASITSNLNVGRSSTGGEHFNGTLDEVLIYNYVLSDAEIDNIYQGVTPTNNPPTFTANPFSKADATEGYVYDASIADAASDPEGGAVTYSKVSGPSWLNIDPDGTLSGVPMHQNVAQNNFTVRATDVDGMYSVAVLTVYVQNTFNGQLGFSDFANFAQHWLESDCVDFPLCSGADLTGDTNVNMDDLRVLGQNWLLQGESAAARRDSNPSQPSGLQTFSERWEFLLK